MNFSSIDLTNIRGVLLDFDNTFYDYEPAHTAGLEAAFTIYGNIEGISHETFLDAYANAQKEVKALIPNTAASHSRFLYFQKMLETRKGVTDVNATILLEEVYWSAFEKAMTLKKEVADFLAKLKESGIKTCLVTDLTAHTQFRKMKAINADTLVDFVVTSEEAGADKPDAAIFSLALKKLGLPKEEVIMIGDDNTKDIDGAKHSGITAYLV